ncbi:MAG: hypothetical protein EOO52_14135 [Gammaproteobacteria bacterium]|nr:MAG: hypothetical protein EOO52_14135 [Gammaproteobacteria bacterium]
MNVLARLLTLCLATLAITAEAKITKYDIENISSRPGYFQYPRLDLSNAKSATLTITKNAPLFEQQLTSVEITFPEAAKLTATNFKLVEGRYRALVSGAWVFKEVIVEVDSINFEQRMPLNINVYVSERTAFINPQAENNNPGGLLFSVMGMVRDATPIRLVDSAALVIGGKKATFSLRDRLQVNPNPGSGNYIPDGFVVDVLWYGRGTKTLYLPAEVAPWDFDSIEVIALVFNGVSDIDRTISVKYKDQAGSERTSPPVPLKNLLDQVYGPIMQ